MTTAQMRRTSGESRPVKNVVSIVEYAGSRPAPVATRLSSHLIEITAGEAVIGFVELADGVFVSLAGDRYNRAVEVGQALDLERAVAAVAA